MTFLLMNAEGLQSSGTFLVPLATSMMTLLMEVRSSSLHRVSHLNLVGSLGS